MPAELPEEYPELEPELDPVVLEQEPQLTGQKVFIIVEDEGLVQPPRFAHAVHEVHTGLPLPSLVALATSASAASLQLVPEEVPEEVLEEGAGVGKGVGVRLPVVPEAVQ